MDCEKFEEHLYSYFTDIELDWGIRNEIDKHYFECDKCYDIYQSYRMMTDKDVKKGVARELADMQINKALHYFDEALRINPGDNEMMGRFKEMFGGMLDEAQYKEKSKEIFKDILEKARQKE